MYSLTTKSRDLLMSSDCLDKILDQAYDCMQHGIVGLRIYNDQAEPVCTKRDLKHYLNNRKQQQIIKDLRKACQDKSTDSWEWQQLMSAWDNYDLQETQLPQAVFYIGVDEEQGLKEYRRARKKRLDAQAYDKAGCLDSPEDYC
jgi:hypothetical protein